ncbi:unnamed protein product [Polarella glacialis]|uniref:Reverse transcriptase domain-containing protein n=1 Tax=Polarella glacialis TaxID=89957 RepID=A0A813GTP0_POLGL|nr:unnamed protein product [Polarella glacialis]
MDRTIAEKDGKLLLLLLDWSKAFDRIRTDSLLVALKRFGLPPLFVQMVGAIYSGRRFTVKDGRWESTHREQASGVSQGCPLSPFLFSILMTVLFHDVDNHPTVCAANAASHHRGFVVTDVLYADDTLLVDSDECRLQACLDCIIALGCEYGLTLNWDKTVLLRIRHEGSVKGPGGLEAKSQDSAIYLGGLLNTSGAATSELTRRMGEAWGSLVKLESVWKHANITSDRKHLLLKSLIFPKLMYGLESVWLFVADRRRLNSFHVKCLRKAYGIKHSYVSHVSNAEVMAVAKAQQLSAQLLETQLRLYGRIAMLDAQSPQRQVALAPDSLRPALSIHKARGRPRIAWAPTIYGHAVAAAGSEQLLREALSTDSWRGIVRKYCHRVGQA